MAVELSLLGMVLVGETYAIVVCHLELSICTLLPNRGATNADASSSFSFSTTMSALPSFLKPLSRPDITHLPYKNAIFRHEAPLEPVHALWWPCKETDSSPDVVLIFIPGNLFRSVIIRTYKEPGVI